MANAFSHREHRLIYDNGGGGIAEAPRAAAGPEIPSETTSSADPSAETAKRVESADQAAARAGQVGMGIRIEGGKFQFVDVDGQARDLVLDPNETKKKPGEGTVLRPEPVASVPEARSPRVGENTVLRPKEEVDAAPETSTDGGAPSPEAPAEMEATPETDSPVAAAERELQDKRQAYSQASAQVLRLEQGMKGQEESPDLAQARKVWQVAREEMRQAEQKVIDARRAERERGGSPKDKGEQIRREMDHAQDILSISTDPIKKLMAVVTLIALLKQQVTLAAQGRLGDKPGTPDTPKAEVQKETVPAAATETAPARGERTDAEIAQTKPAESKEATSDDVTKIQNPKEESAKLDKTIEEAGKEEKDLEAKRVDQMKKLQELLNGQVADGDSNQTDRDAVDAVQKEIQSLNEQIKKAEEGGDKLKARKEALDKEQGRREKLVADNVEKPLLDAKMGITSVKLDGDDLVVTLEKEDHLQQLAAALGQSSMQDSVEISKEKKTVTIKDLPPDFWSDPGTGLLTQVFQKVSAKNEEKKAPEPAPQAAQQPEAPAPAAAEGSKAPAEEKEKQPSLEERARSVEISTQDTLANLYRGRSFLGYERVTKSEATVAREQGEAIRRGVSVQVRGEMVTLTITPEAMGLLTDEAQEFLAKRFALDARRGGTFSTKDLGDIQGPLFDLRAEQIRNLQA